MSETDTANTADAGPMKTAITALRMLNAGWTVAYRRAINRFEWRAPEGISEDGFCCLCLDAPPAEALALFEQQQAAQAQRLAALPTIEDQWQGYAAVIYRRCNPSQAQQNETRQAFFAGATAMLRDVRRLGDEDFSEEDGCRWLEQTWQEAHAFARSRQPVGTPPTPASPATTPSQEGQ